MSPDNCKLIRHTIAEAATDLKGRLPKHPAHPAGRNPYAHIPKVIKDICNGKSYKDMPDSALEDILSLIEYCRVNPF
jgi:hypothetical protein